MAFWGSLLLANIILHYLEVSPLKWHDDCKFWKDLSIDGVWMLLDRSVWFFSFEGCDWSVLTNSARSLVEISMLLDQLENKEFGNVSVFSSSLNISSQKLSDKIRWSLWDCDTGFKIFSFKNSSHKLSDNTWLWSSTCSWRRNVCEPYLSVKKNTQVVLELRSQFSNLSFVRFK